MKTEKAVVRAAMKAYALIGCGDMTCRSLAALDCAIDSALNEAGETNAK